jgi:hypothetical protein
MIINRKNGYYKTRVILRAFAGREIVARKGAGLPNRFYLAVTLRSNGISSKCVMRLKSRKR